MKPLSKKEVEIISSLEFHKKYFFTAEDIDKFARNKTQRYNIIKNLKRKGRIVKINREKYYLIPIKAKSGSWTEDPFIIADEICNGKDYFIGGWAAANYWRLTEQIPMRVDVYTTRRQGRVRVLHTLLVFHRTTQRRTDEAVDVEIQGHRVWMLSKEAAKKWMRPRKSRLRS